MSGQKNHFSLTVQLQNIILRRNARRKNNGARLAFHFRLPVSTSVQVVIHSLVTMKCSGMHANTVCCAGVHIQEKKKKKRNKLTALVYSCLTYCSFWRLNIELERQLSGVWAGFRLTKHLRWLNPSWTQLNSGPLNSDIRRKGNIREPCHIQVSFPLSANSTLHYSEFYLEHNNTWRKKNIPRIIISKYASICSPTFFFPRLKMTQFTSLFKSLSPTARFAMCTCCFPNYVIPFFIIRLLLVNDHQKNK